MVRVGVDKAALGTGRLWRIAVLTAAGADRRRFAGGSRPLLLVGFRFRSITGPHRRRRSGGKSPARQAKKIELPEKESAKPQGPLVISISIDQQNVKVYDDQRLLRGSARFPPA